MYASRIELPEADSESQEAEGGTVSEEAAKKCTVVKLAVRTAAANFLQTSFVMPAKELSDVLEKNKKNKVVYMDSSEGTDELLRAPDCRPPSTKVGAYSCQEFNAKITVMATNRDAKQKVTLERQAAVKEAEKARIAEQSIAHHNLLEALNSRQAAEALQYLQGLDTTHLKQVLGHLSVECKQGNRETLRGKLEEKLPSAAQEKLMEARASLQQAADDETAQSQLADEKAHSDLLHDLQNKEGKPALQQFQSTSAGVLKQVLSHLQVDFDSKHKKKALLEIALANLPADVQTKLSEAIRVQREADKIRAEIRAAKAAAKAAAALATQNLAGASEEAQGPD
jgi:hypothetical protein